MLGATVAGWQEWSREAQLVAVRFPAELADELVAGALGTLEVPALLAAGGLRSERPVVVAADRVLDSVPREDARRAVPAPGVRRAVRGLPSASRNHPDRASISRSTR